MSAAAANFTAAIARLLANSPSATTSVASPRKMKKPPESVTAVIITDDPTAGSRPSFSITIGIATPITAASMRFSVIASTITSPSETSL